MWALPATMPSASTTSLGVIPSRCDWPRRRWPSDRECDLDAVTVKAVVEGLTDLYLGVLDAETRRALDAASVVRRTTLSLLAAMLPESAAPGRL